MGIKEDLRMMTIEKGDLEDKYYNLKEKSSILICVLIIMLCTIVFLLIMWIVISHSKNNAIEVLDLEDTLIRYHVLKYYPEFEGCVIKYSTCVSEPSAYCKRGAEIYCNQSEGLNPKDGLIPVSTLKKKLLDEVLILRGIKLKDIYVEWKLDGFK